MNTTNEGGEPGYKKYILVIAFLVVLWGIVPGFAQLGGLPGDVTTLYVNWVATIALAVILTVRGGWSEFKKYKASDYLRMIGWGFIWPFVYSIAYFQSVLEVGAGLTTILNYTWPIFFMGISIIAHRGSSDFVSGAAYKYVVPVLLAFGAVFAFMYDSAQFVLSWAIALGLLAAFTQAYFSFSTSQSKHKYDDWALTFVVELVTAVLVTIFVMARGSFVVPSLQVFGYLAVIGALSNGIGFWLFVRAGKISASLAKQQGLQRRSDPLFLIGLSMVPLSQLVFLPMMGIEITRGMIWSLILIGMSFLFYMLFNNRKPREPSMAD